MPVLDTQKLINNRVDAIRKYHRSSGILRAQLDVSGGLDSAVMLGLLTRTIGPQNITAVYSDINSSQESRDRAQEVANKFGVHLHIFSLNEIFGLMVGGIKFSLSLAPGESLENIEKRCSLDPTIEGSLRSCLRAPLGRAFNRISGGGIRHGTGNECEDRWLRFYQKGGDGEVDTNPIAMLSKGEVFQLGRALGVPKSILDAMPTPDLQGVGETHNDEAELKALTGVDWTYSKVDSETGEYTKVGTIERISRLDDDSCLFDSYCDDDTEEILLERSEENISFSDLRNIFFGYDIDQVMEMIKSAIHQERITKHKMNPNCPSLGSRRELLELDILTDKLPRV